MPAIWAVVAWVGLFGYVVHEIGFIQAAAALGAILAVMYAWNRRPGGQRRWSR